MKSLKTWMFRFILLIISGDASAFCIIANSGCPKTGVGWPNSAATFNSNGFSGSSATFDNAFPSAIRAWNGPSNFVFSNVSAAADPCVGEADGTRSWEFSSNICGSSFGSQTLAVTFVYAISFSPSVNTIGDADIIYNINQPWGWDVHNGPAFSVDFRRVTVHESGHAFGLGHDNTAAAAIMDPFYSETIQTPQTDDINGLIALYGRSTTPVPPTGSQVNMAPINFLLLD